MRPYSPHAGALSDSETLAITARARALRAQGKEVAPFAAGEPDFDTPPHVAEAAREAIRQGRTRYGPAGGIAPLREAVAQHLEALGLAGLTPARTIVSAGAKGVIYLALQVLLREGDEVLVPTPCWLSYPSMIQAAGGKVVPVPTEASTGWRIDPDAVRRAVTPRTRALILNSPCNPTGAVQSDAVLRVLGEIAAENDWALLSDEIYEHLAYAPARFRSVAAIVPEVHDRLLVVNGVSKAYAMTGWRIGYGGGPAEWIDRMIRLQSHALGGPPEINQAAALAALQGPQDLIHVMHQAFHRRRDAMCEELGRLPDISFTVPGGAFYVLVDVRPVIGRHFRGRRIDDATTLSSLLLDEAHAAVVPGDAFYAPGALRLSYACKEVEIRRGIQRMGAFLAALD